MPVKKEIDSHTCKNCGVHFYGTYCNHCGQHWKADRLSMRTMIGHLTYGLVNCDRGILYTIRELFLRPGPMLRGYIEGHRIIYFRPFSMLIILCGLYGLLQTITRIGMGEAEQPIAMLEETAPLSLRFLWAGFNTMRHSVLFLSILMLPFYALFTRVLFRRRGARQYNYWELLYVNVFMACQRLMIDVVFFPMRIWMEAVGRNYTTFMVLAYMAVTVWDYKQLFGTGWIRGIWKTVVLFLLSFLTAALCVFLLVLIIAAIVLWIKGGDLSISVPDLFTDP